MDMEMLHKPWGKAVDTPGYDKHEWQALQTQLFNLQQLQGTTTLRDKFAMAALTGLLADPNVRGGSETWALAWEIADGMLELRKS